MIPVLSIIVPAHNEQQLLGRTLATLQQAASETGLTWELIVVNDSSTDATPRIAEAHGARVVNVSFRHIAATRNAGAAAARGKWLLFVDADTVVPPATLRATMAALQAGVSGGGASVHLDGRLPLIARLGLPVFRLAMRAARLAAGCYVFCTRAAFEMAGGFDPTLFAGEELAFSRRLWRAGPFRVLREPVYSSGRKLRTHSLAEMAWLIAQSLRGPALVRSRRHLALWYGDRRDDPDFA